MDIGEKVMIVKAKRGEKMTTKVRRKVKKGYAPDEYTKVCNPSDFKSLALLFEDLELIVGAPVEKAFKEFKRKKNEDFPFF
jgi:hypothetical protein